jgi:hypothetical protein
MAKDNTEHWKVLFDEEHGVWFSQQPHATMSAEVGQLDSIKRAVESARRGDQRILRWELTNSGFFPATAEFLVRCILGRKPRRPHRWMEFWRGRLEEIKKEMRERGDRSRIHETAIEALEREHVELITWLKAAAPRRSFGVPAFDRDKFENFYRRSKQPRKRRSTKSRAK